MKCLKILLAVFVAGLITGCSQSEQNRTGSGSAQPLETETKEEHSAVETTQWEDIYASGEAASASSDNEDRSIIPAAISIPAIDVSAAIEHVGKLSNGQMGVPEQDENVGWYEFGAKPGEQGSAVMAGHVDNKTGPAVFYHLEDMKEGDKIHITNVEGEQLTFEVYQTKSYPKDEAPISEVFGYTAARTLKLITCTGEFLDNVGTHENRLVVSAQLVE
ncbi:class F sortase [Gracilibacillus caseinilyticus]|uniref:Class F sortase n=1 Tax=Gracilibacillus caseinilyticus TaxID=2932256 RepID=A0ABY4EZL9_9BACI|nr:class F sortase [Gracilibacillus caseinilyticus]UOQ49840.1 class F sortase [Gracilibacillus caseinilyticus]